MKQIMILSLALGLISAVATGLLSWTNDLTKEPIAISEKAQNEKALKEILPDFDNAPLQEAKKFKVGDREFEIMPAKKAGDLVGYAVKGYSTKGFSGRIDMLVGFGTDGKITNVKVTNHKETPGLGTNVTDRVKVVTILDVLGMADDNKKAKPSFIDKFAGRQMEDAEAYFFIKGDGGEIDAVSGATVSSRAVTDGVSRICEAYLKFMKKNGGAK